MKRLNAKIDVFFSTQKKDYYVRIKISRREELPSYEDMATEEQKHMLCVEYPELAGLLRKKKPSDEEIELDIDPKIKEYNERTRSMVRRRWKIYYGGALRQINDESDALALDKKLTAFIDLKYDGTSDDSAIIKFIQVHQSENGKDIYIAYECGGCGQIEYSRLISGKACCTKCGHGITLNDDNVSKFVGENALIRAAQSANEKKAKKIDTVHADAIGSSLPKIRSFYYNKISYGISLPEFKALHEVLFADCAVEKVFITDDGGNITFNPDYENYIRIINEKGIVAKLYKNKSQILREINSASNTICGAMAGFYWYFNEYELTQSSALRWKVEGDLFAFNTTQEYIAALCSADDIKRQALVSLFNEQTCQKFFYGYEYSLIELSRLIYDTTGKFIHIAEDNKILTDFGTNFINHLSDFDNRIAIRNEFLESIHADTSFWDKIKGSIDELTDGYYSNDESYYDRLCFYQFAILGKTVMKFKSLQIRNSKDGIEYIKSIVTSAYLRNDNGTQTHFSDLVQMLFKTSLFDSMIIGNECVIKAGQLGSIPFIEGLTKLVNEGDKTPNIDAYLFCLNTINKRTKIIYNGGNADTLINLAHSQIKADNGNGAYLNFILSDSIITLIKSILGENYEIIVSESENYFNNVIAEIQKLQISFNEKIEKLASERIARRPTPQSHNEQIATPQSQPQSINGTQPKNETHSTKREDTSDEWA